jgi:hypothetical protein
VVKKLVKVVYEKEIEIEINDELLTEEAIQEFSRHMFSVTEADALFGYAAFCIFDKHEFIEGLGKARDINYGSSELSGVPKPTENDVVKYLIVYEDSAAYTLEDL